MGAAQGAVGVPACPFVEAADQGEQAVRRGVEVRCELGDLVREAVDLGEREERVLERDPGRCPAGRCRCVLLARWWGDRLGGGASGSCQSDFARIEQRGRGLAAAAGLDGCGDRRVGHAPSLPRHFSASWLRRGAANGHGADAEGPHRADRPPDGRCARCDASLAGVADIENAASRNPSRVSNTIVATVRPGSTTSARDREVAARVVQIGPGAGR